MIPILEKIASSNRVGSAYLFTGVSPHFLSRQALLFAKRLNCEKSAICNECIPCKKIDRICHPDLFLIKSEGHSIKIDTIRDLQKYLHYKPFEAKYKIAIIHDAEELQMISGNAILKILEEPPPQTIFLLLTLYEEKILPTILSRCQIVRMSHAENEARSISDGDSSHSVLGMTWLGMTQLPKEPDKIFELAKEISKEEQTLELFLETWLNWYQTLLIYKTGATPNHSFFKEKEGFLLSTLKDFTLQELYKRIDAILETKRSLDFQVNRELLAEQILIQLTKRNGSSEGIFASDEARRNE
jgi:DNA polymerase-3 subunit delta'